MSIVALMVSEYYHDSKFSDREVWANSAEPDQTASDHQFRLHLLEELLYGRTLLFRF